ncbi:hypothetical protein HAHE_07520 [Haloferula helveola]|uniref:DNA-binding transcriptional regulator, LacI/PurR family n=1 Tax=Haloferula helveola TaxID=490095 RepID=A0ABM7RGG3_9BACT|nr:hypothetical protein HAHE_07520 [Haloferula helveola]
MFRPLSHVEQVAAHLRSELEQGRWSGEMPGVFRLEQELGVNHGVVHRALGMLEDEGMLENQGRGRKRRIIAKRAGSKALTVRVLLYERSDLRDDYLLDLMHLLRGDGHDADFADRTLLELGMDVRRVARFVNATESDAWVVLSGSTEVLRWFSRQPTPAFALFGLTEGVEIAFAAPRKRPAIAELLEHLIGLGHRRIVHIVREEHRKPELGAIERFILGYLEERGVATGPYNIPDWSNSPAGLHGMLDSIFRHTPPTALLVDEPSIFLATQNHLANQGIRCPERVSLACYDDDSSFDWFLPRVTHISWDPKPLMRGVVRWVNKVAQGRNAPRPILVKSKLVHGGTTGPAVAPR